MKKRWQALPSIVRWLLVTVVIMAIAGGVAYAIYSHSIPSHVKIISPPGPGPEPEVALAFYKEKGCTTPATFIVWGELEQGQTKTSSHLFWVKNTGNLAATISGSSTLATGVGSLTLEFTKDKKWEATLELGVGEACEVKGELVVKADADLGDAYFDIIVSASP